MRVKATFIAIAAALLFATGAGAVNVQETVQMITHTDLIMKDGSTMHARHRYDERQDLHHDVGGRPAGLSAPASSEGDAAVIVTACFRTAAF